MSLKKERHILALSGGKDSAALAVYMREKYPDMELEYVFTDSGCELPETYEYLDRIRAVLNIQIVSIKSKKNWEDYWSLVKFKRTTNGTYTYLPSPKNRWCTEVLKLFPYQQWLAQNYNDFIIHSYVGLRADEKRERKGFLSTSKNRVEHHPFIEDGLGYDDIKYLLNKSGIGFPAYYEWRTRSGCYFCFYQTKKEWLGLYKNHPELFRKAQSFEFIDNDKGIRYTWCDDMSLDEILYHEKEILEKSEENNKRIKQEIKLTDVLSSFKFNEGNLIKG